MDAESRAMLDRILSLEPAALSEGDIAFLRARVDYLSEAEKEAFKDVLTVKTARASKADKDDK